ncbi:MAG: elongation factor Ts [Pseudomonadota bacterium]|nr:elongation factor Ts [Pseudomonadota bacterium]MDE3037226.1 elongation factor Ts [Pseudomonadota bacterium]
MPQVTADQIKNLRETTGAGMLDCRKALTEAAGDMEQAVDWLRKKGLSAAAKKSGRVAAEGVVAIAAEGAKAAIIELNSETDFVARNDQFQTLARAIAEIAVRHDIGDVEELKNAGTGHGKTVAEDITGAVATIGEHINLRRASILGVSRGIVASYIHNAVAPGMGKIGILVALESTAEIAKLEAFGKQIAMHIAAARPDALTVADIDPAKLSREREVYREQARASGKPPEVVEKMIEGRVRKFYEETVLLEQVFVIDNKTKISQVVANAAKDLGAPVKINGFVRFTLGEGIEKQQSDFAAEVKAAGGAA